MNAQIVVRKIDNGFLFQAFSTPENASPVEVTRFCHTEADVRAQTLAFYDQIKTTIDVVPPVPAVSSSGGDAA
jgi:hypothetical protein